MTNISEIDTLVLQAEELSDNGNSAEAAKLFKHVLELDNTRSDAWINYGNAMDAQGDKKAAADAYVEALKIDSGSVIALGNLSGTMYEMERYKEAIDFADQALQLDDKYVMAMVNKANVLDVQGRRQDAIELYKRAIKTDPQYAIAYSNLGSVYYEEDQMDKAGKMLKKALKLDPQDVNALINLANVLDTKDDMENAVLMYEKALELDPENSTAYNNLGSAYEKVEDRDKAAEAYWKAMEYAPDYQSAHLNYGYLLYDLVSADRRDEAIELGKRWVDTFPDNSIAVHMTASVSTGEPPSRASDNYVKELFDAFAPDFDSNLKSIDYKAPKIIAKAVRKLTGKPEANRNVLDAGCGTGLCAPLIKPYAQEGGFTGVDLSAGMLDKARERKLYDKLEESELTGWLENNNDSYNLIVCADVLTYFGALDDVIKAFGKNLALEGWLFFTVTRHVRKDTDKDYLLMPSGRYSHHENYIEKTVTNAGLELVKLEKCVLRKEAGTPVNGFVVCCRKAEA